MRLTYCTIMMFAVSSALVSTSYAAGPAGQNGNLPQMLTASADRTTQTSLLPPALEAAATAEVATDQNGDGASCCCEPLRKPFSSDHEFDGFVEPITNSVFFEDPRSRTRLRFFFVNQMIPDKSILGGGDLQLYAAQVTVALNDRWTFIAQKDGYLALQAGGLPNTTGWADLATGIKYVLVRDVENQFLLSTGMLYEWSNGTGSVFQGNGSGVWNFFLTTGKEFGKNNKNHFVGTFGWHLPNDGTQESESIFYSLHLDRNLVGGLYAVWEMNGIHYVSSAQRLPGVTTEGGDLINLGAGAVAGNDFLSMSFGGVYKFNSHLECAAAWETPIGREDLLESRTTVTLSLIY